LDYCAISLIYKDARANDSFQNSCHTTSDFKGVTRKSLIMRQTTMMALVIAAVFSRYFNCSDSEEFVCQVIGAVSRAG
jgi:hypothetical protein